MENGITEIIALPLSGVTTLLIAIIGFFLKNTMAELRKLVDNMSALTMRVVIIEQRDGQLLQLQDDIAKIRDDMVWMRERLAILTVGKNTGN
jgi:hypothetical protein